MGTLVNGFIMGVGIGVGLVAVIVTVNWVDTMRDNVSDWYNKHFC